MIALFITKKVLNNRFWRFIGSYYQPNEGIGQIEILDRDIEYAKVHVQVSKLGLLDT